MLTRALIADTCDRFPNIVINDCMPGSPATDMGISDGLDPKVAAAWGATLALFHDRSLTGTIWDRDTEHLPPRTLNGRVKNLLLMHERKPRNGSELPAWH